MPRVRVVRVRWRLGSYSKVKADLLTHCSPIIHLLWLSRMHSGVRNVLRPPKGHGCYKSVIQIAPNNTAVSQQFVVLSFKTCSLVSFPSRALSLATHTHTHTCTHAHTHTRTRTLSFLVVHTCVRCALFFQSG